MKIILCPNPFRDKGLKAAGEAQRLLTAAGASCEFCFPFPVEPSHFNTLPSGIKIKEMKAELPDANFLVCFGGDGTILHAAKDASSFGVPIIGVNMGSVGFMAELEQNEISKLKRLIGGEYAMENRMLLDVKVLRDGRALFRSTALNDAVITKGAVARVIDLQIFGDKSRICNTYGDGVGLSDGMTISFHHHLRNGDMVAVMVLDVISELGIKDLNVNISSIFDTHAPFIE